MAAKHGVLLVPNMETKQVDMHSLVDGSLVRKISNKGYATGQLNYACSGLCISPDGDSVLVVTEFTDCVHEIRIVDGSWVRGIGKGVLKLPQCVDCNTAAIAISESSCHRISILSWTDGSVLAQFGSRGSGPGQLNWPCGIRLLDDGSGVVVADHWNHRLCVFTLRGKFVEAVGSKEQGLNYPIDVLQRASDQAFLVANCGASILVEIRHGTGGRVYCKGGVGEFIALTALAALPNGGVLVPDTTQRLQQLLCYRIRLVWMSACVCARASACERALACPSKVTKSIITM